MTGTLLLVDDEPKVLEGLRRTLRDKSLRVLAAASAVEGLEVLAREKVDVVMSDERMPGMAGCEFLAEVRRRHPETVRLMLTGHASVEAAVKAINEGQIYRFLVKPADPAELRATVQQALEQKAMAAESAELLEQLAAQSGRLASLEGRYPGITRVERDDDGSVIIDAAEE